MGLLKNKENYCFCTGLFREEYVCVSAERSALLVIFSYLNYSAAFKLFFFYVQSIAYINYYYIYLILLIVW